MVIAMTMSRDIACALLDNMRNKATELETDAIEYAIKMLPKPEQGTENVVDFPSLGVDVVAYDKEKVREYLSEKLGNEVTENYVDNLFRRKGFPCKRLGRKLYVEPDKLDGYLIRERIITIPKTEEKN